MKLLADWAWKPDQMTKEALQRGNFKITAHRLESRNLFNFHVEPARKLTKEEVERRNVDRQLIRDYLERISAAMLVPTEKIIRQKGGRMQWVALIDQTNKSARVVSKHATEMAARKAAGDIKGVEEYTIIESGKSLRGLTDVEVDALMVQFDDKRTNLHRPLKELIVRGYLEQFDPTWHKPYGQVSNGHYQPPAIPKEAEMEVQTSSTTKGKKAVKAKPAAKATAVKAAAKPAGKTNGKKTNGKKVEAKAAPKGRQKVQDTGDGLGREGTPARFIREMYKAGKETKEIFEAAVKKFPDNNIKNTGYVSWYYNDMVKRGLIKKH